MYHPQTNNSYSYWKLHSNSICTLHAELQETDRSRRAAKAPRRRVCVANGEVIEGFVQGLLFFLSCLELLLPQKRLPLVRLHKMQKCVDSRGAWTAHQRVSASLGARTDQQL